MRKSRFSDEQVVAILREADREPIAAVAILGIDAAWTPTQPTGIAVITQESAGWRLISAEPSGPPGGAVPSDRSRRV